MARGNRTGKGYFQKAPEIPEDPIPKSDTQLELIGGEIVDAPEKPRYFMSEKALAQRRAAANASLLAKHENTERLEFMVHVAEIAKDVDRNDPDSMLAAFHKYLILSAEWGQKVGNMTAYAAMGTNKTSIDEWYHGNSRADDPRYRELATYVKSMCAAYREQLGLDGKTHPALTIFWQRNFDGFTNEDIVRVEREDPLGILKDAKQIAEKYKDMPDD